VSRVTDSEVRASEHSGGARASAGRKSICCGVPYGVRSGGSCMCFNPGVGQGMLEAYVMEKLANTVNERFVAAGLDMSCPQNDARSAHCR